MADTQQNLTASVTNIHTKAWVEFYVPLNTQ